MSGAVGAGELITPLVSAQPAGSLQQLVLLLLVVVVVVVVVIVILAVVVVVVVVVVVAGKKEGTSEPQKEVLREPEKDLSDPTA